MARSSYNDNMKVAATIDLHGKNKEKAISQLTQFLSETVRRHGSGTREGMWVLIITGAGNHSQNGPVLRNAVQSTLEKRRMKYKIQPGQGSIIVRADSGFELHSEGPKQDTKVILASTVHRSHLCISDSAIGSAQMNKHGNREVSHLSSLVENAPLPREVRDDEKALKTGKIMSLEEERSKQKKKTRERKDMQKALDVSLEICRKQDEKKEEEERMLQEILALSEKESAERVLSEEEEIEAAIKMSLEPESSDSDEDDELAAAIQKSLELERIRISTEIEAERLAGFEVYGCDSFLDNRGDGSYDQKTADFINVPITFNQTQGENSEVIADKQDQLTLGERMILTADGLP